MSDQPDLLRQILDAAAPRTRTFPLPPILSPTPRLSNLPLVRLPVKSNTSQGLSLDTLIPPTSTKQVVQRVEADIKKIATGQLTTSTTQIIPNIEDVSYSESKILETSVLHIDMRGSTDIVRAFSAIDALKIYKIFHGTIVTVARYKKARVRTFAGDRVGVVFDVTKRVSSNAVETALLMQAVLECVVNPYLLQKFRYEIKYGIGISVGEMLVGRIGQYGTSNNDLVWLGEAMNVASKLADEGEGVKISDEVYRRMYPGLKQSENMLWLECEAEKIGKYYDFIGIPKLII